MSQDISEKLQKVLARAGLGSRREMERAIESGLAKVNGKIATLGDRVIGHDKLSFRGKKVINPLSLKQRTKVIVYYKPEGLVCSRSDEKDRPTVFDSLPAINKGRWIMIGRLDLNTSGLLLFTNNGELANRLMHPSYEIEREYAVRVFGEVDNKMLKKLREGIKLEDGLAKFDSVQFKGGEGLNQWYHVILREGRNREIRRLWESLPNIKVSRLIRVRFANIILPRYLSRNKHQYLEAHDVKRLLQQVKLNDGENK